jgi:signal transduction histidine kinase
VSDDSVTLWVEDEGPGLPATPHDSLFHRFVRAPNGEPDQNGMGLGLAIVKSIVERHGGRVEASSGDNKTQMRVILPRQEALEQLQQTSYTHNT